MTNVASSATATAGRSPAGSACESAPPKVPRCRTAGSATVLVAWASSGQCSATSGSCITSWWVVIDADHQLVAVPPDAAQLADPADVDEHGRVRQPQPQQRQQALPAGEHLGVLAGPAELGDRLVDRVRPQVVELRGDHSAPPAVVAVCGPPYAMVPSAARPPPSEPSC